MVAYEYLFNQILFQNPNVKSVRDIYKFILAFDVHKHSQIQQLDVDIRDVFHILLDSNQERRLKKIVPKELVGLAFFNTNQCNFDSDDEETVNKVMTVVTKLKAIKKDGVEVLNEKYLKNKNKKNIAEYK